MAARTTIKKRRLQQLYAQGLTMSLIALRFRISHQAVSKMLNRNAKLRRQHVAHRTRDRKLLAGENRQRMRKRAQEWYAQGLLVKFVIWRLELSEQVVTEMIEGDAKIERLHAARVALDKKLLAGEPVTEADFAVDQDQVAPRSDGNRRRDAAGDDRGEPTPSRAQAAVAEDAESATDGHSESATSERPKAQPESATFEQPKAQPPREATESATQKAKPTSSPQSDLQERAAAAVQLVIKHVCAEYGYRPTQFTGKETAPEFKEARQVAMFMALRVTGLSAVLLAPIFDCTSNTIYQADAAIELIFLGDHTRRARILSAEAQIRGETGLRYR